MEGLPGAEFANGFELGFVGAPKENTGFGFVADVGVCPNVKAEVGRLSSLPKLKVVLMGGAWGAPNPPNGLSSSLLVAKVVDEPPKANGAVVEPPAVDPLEQNTAVYPIRCRSTK